MNVAFIKSQVAARASQAAKAFQLDKMAETDEYIKSEGLNVKRTCDRSSSKQASYGRSDSNDTNSFKEQQAIQSTLEPTNIDMSKIYSDGLSGTSRKVVQQPSTNSYMMPSVATVLQQSQSTPKEHNLDFPSGKTFEKMRTNAKVESRCNPRRATSQLDELYDSDQDHESSDEDEYNSKRTTISPLSHQHTSSIEYSSENIDEVNSHDSINTIDKKKSPKKKDVNRFLSDLDARLQCDNNGTSSSISQIDDGCQQTSIDKLEKEKEVEPLNIIGSFTESKDKMSWIQNVASPRLNQAWNKMRNAAMNTGSHQNGEELESLTSDELKISNSKQGTYHEEDAFGDVISSSSLTLGEDESAELERIRQRMNSRDPLSMLMELAIEHRNYLGVFVTFVVTTFGYFLTRKADDTII